MSINDLPSSDRDVATAWLRGLAARGVSVSLRNHQLKLAYNLLTDDEVLVLRHHRAAIKAVITEGVSCDVVPPAAPVVETAPAAPAPACPYCMRAPCIGRAHPAFAVLHALDEAEQWRRMAEQREQDYREWELRLRYGLPSPTWD